MAALLVGCGGGGGGGDSGGPAPSPPPPPPPSSNSAPTLTVEDQATAEEGQTSAVLSIEAADPDGEPLMFSLSGPDADAFSLGSETVENADGDGTFSNEILAAGLDFETPTDADGDGIYRVTISVSDGTESANQDVDITITDQRFGDGFSFETAATGFLRPIQTVRVPDTGDIFLIEQAGRILFSEGALPSGGGNDPVALDLRGQVSGGNEQGLLGLALSPNFANDRTLYVNLTNIAGDTEIRQYRLFSNRNDLIDPSTEQLILRIPQPFSNHNAGWIGFDGAGNLLIPTGDGGGANDPAGNGQDRFSLLGKVLRINPAGDDFPVDGDRNYAIPSDNPFADGQDAAPEIFALGLRNPYRADYDPVSNTLYIAEVGQGAREEVNALPIGTGGGTNFGWPLFEGRLPLLGNDDTGLTPPLAEYAHGEGEGRGRSISGGFVTRLAFDGRSPDEAFFVFGDFITGNLWVLDLGKVPAGGSIDAATFEALDPAGPIRRIGGLDQVTNVSAGAPGEVLFSSLDGQVVVGAREADSGG
ncbi:MAG: PQQ-dependent sugar dehydrogenase [Pseudomonadota bacterium]